MRVCDTCGSEIEFRTIDGRVVPIHVAGYCQSRESGAEPDEPKVSVSRFFANISVRTIGARSWTSIRPAEARDFSAQLLAAARDAEGSPPPPPIHIEPPP